MQTKYALLLALKIAVMLLMITIAIELEYHIRPLYWRIIKLICFFIEQGLVWIYTFISFGFSLISFLLKIALTSASAFCYVFRAFVQTVDFLLKAIIQVAILLIICSLGVLITCSHTMKKDKSFNPNDSRMDHIPSDNQRRRPRQVVSKDDISQPKRSQKAFPAHNQQEGNTRGTDNPSNWSQLPSTRPYQRVRLSPMEEGNTRGTDKPSSWSQMPSTRPYQRVQLSPMEERNTRGTDKPSHWSHMPSTTPYQRVRLSPITDEFKEIEKLFKNSFKWSVEILAIERVQNPYEWEKYQRKKENMAAAHTGSAEERSVNEMRLFHGTNPQVVKAICKHNFDWRVNGKNGTVYGQGSYFAVNSSKSDCYAKEDNKRSKFMFVAKVLAGSYTEGKSSYQRPPSKNPGNPASDLYDSCVDKMSSPSIFVIFQNDQLYPEYIIEYSTARGASLADMVMATKALIDGVSSLFGRRN